MGNLCSLSISTEATLSRCWDCVVGQASYTCKLEQNLQALSIELESLKARRDDVNQRVVFAQQQHMTCLNEVQLWLNRAGTMIAEVEELIQKGPQEVQKLCLAGCFSMNYKSSYKFGREVIRKLEEIGPLKNEGVFEQVADQNEANLKALSAALEDLKALRADVNWKVDLAEQQGMKRLNLVQVWLSRSETVISEAEQLLSDAHQDIEKLRPDMARLLEEIVTLKNQGVLNKVAVNEPVAAADVRPVEWTVGSESTLSIVCNLLQQTDVGIVGLFGLGGVGKTTLLTQIHNKLLSIVPYCYGAIIWVVVSKDHTIENLQTKIGEKLQLAVESWKNKSYEEKSQDIHRILRRKKFVLFLDDIWEHVDLKKIGIPLPNKENGSRVVFTTRLSNVCSQMKANEMIEVKCLGQNEAWALFQHNVGEDTLNSHPNIQDLVEKVAAECRGLPLALVVIGRAMAGKKSPASWEYAIEVLKNSAHKFANTTRELYSVLKFSYDSLPSDTMRSCLLYCCLYPEDHSIKKSSLIEYWFCEGLLDEFESISKARLQGHHIIDSLINASLLEQVRLESDVKMHDVIRDMSLWISCECEATIKNRFYVQAGLQLTDVPEAGKWQGVGRVSFMENRIKGLTSTPICPNLQTLFLNGNKVLCWIENGFFQLMPNLKVLNLSGCRELKKLPEGISCLVSLECLDLSGTKIEELPMELKSLTNLKWLDLTDTGNPVLRIPHGLICSFSKLQVIRVFRNPKLEGAVWIGGEDERGLIEEMGSLQHLNVIHLEMKGALALERLLRFHNLRSCIEELRLYDFSESKVFNVSSLANMKSLKFLELNNCERVEEMKTGRVLLESSHLLPTINTSCFHSLEKLDLFNCGKLRDMTWLIFAPNLRILGVFYCGNMEEIIREGEVGNPIPQPFPKLEWLFLCRLPELKSIYPKAMPFLFLRKMFVLVCSKLKKLPLNADSAKGNNLTICGSSEWWEEVEWEDEATRNAFLPSFKGYP